MVKKKQKVLRKSNQVNGLKKKEFKRQDSSTSTCTDLNEIFYGVENIKLQDENECLSKKENHSLKYLNGKPKGLRNFGNTCYLNSCIQVLCQTPMFYELINKNADSRVDWSATHEDYFKKKLKDRSVNIDDYQINCKLSAPSILHSCLVSLLHSLRSELKSSSDIISPKNFVREIKSSFVQFSDNDQQDSHEFLRYLLLEGIRTSVIKRQYKAILNHFQVDTKQIRLSKDDEKFPQVQVYTNSSNFTIIDSIFGGYTISSLKCEKCEYNSQIFEPFYELSLPMVDDNKYNNCKKQKINFKEKNKENVVEKRNYLLEKNSKKLTMKERKLKRQIKKAAKRETKKSILKQEEKNDNNSDKSFSSDDEKKLHEIKNNEKEIDIKLIEKSCKESDEPYDDVLTISIDNHINEKPMNSNKSCGESSDDEASSKDEFDDLNDDNSEKTISEKINEKSISEKINEKIIIDKNEQSNNSNDSGINNLNLASDVNNIDSKNSTKLISSNEDKIISELPIKEKKNSYSDKESDTGFEDKESLLNGEADSESEESNSGDVEANDNDSNSDKNLNTMSIASDDEDMSEEEDCFLMENKEDYEKKIKYILSTVSEKTDVSTSCSLQACFSAFTKTELMVGSNKLYCKNCTKKFRLKNDNKKKVYTNASRQTLIALPPAILFLQLKRFEMNNFRSFSKINQHVRFPLVFDLSPYVSNVHKIIENLKFKNSVNYSEKEIIYSLYGIIEHTGSLRFGHYKAYVRYNNKESQDLKKFLHMTSYIPKINEIMESISVDDININSENKKQENNGKADNNLNNLSKKFKEEFLLSSESRWFLVNDSNVTQVDLKNVLKAQAYLLFYERR